MNKDKDMNINPKEDMKKMNIDTVEILLQTAVGSVASYDSAERALDQTYANSSFIVRFMARSAFANTKGALEHMRSSVKKDIIENAMAEIESRNAAECDRSTDVH